MRISRGVCAIILGAIALVAVFHISEDTASIVHETKLPATRLPEEVDQFIQEAVTYPDSFEAFAKFQTAKDKAEAGASKAKFEDASSVCRTLRTKSYKECGAAFCDAKKTCGDECKVPYGQGPLQILPLHESGAHFYKVQEVGAKEHNVKENYAKKMAKKELEDKAEITEKAAYKQKVAEENKKNEIKKKARDKAEKVEKEVNAKERVTKERKEKAESAAREAQILFKCTATSDKVAAACYTNKAQEKVDKALAKATLLKQARTAQEANMKKEVQDKANVAGKNMTQDQYIAQTILEREDAGAIMNQDDAIAAANHTNLEAVIAEKHAEAQADEAAVQATSASNMQSNLDQTLADDVSQGLDMVVPPEFTPEVTTDMNYASTAIPAGGTPDTAAGDLLLGRRLLQTAAEVATIPPPTSVEEAAANPIPEPEGTEDLSVKPAGESDDDLEANIASLEDTVVQEQAKVAKDHTALDDVRAVAALQVNVTNTADQVFEDAEASFNNVDSDFENEDNNARLHGAKAAMVEAQVKAVDSYVKHHQGELHKTNCTEEKKFAFDVCIGRNAYGLEVRQAKASAAARLLADKYKEIMADDFKVVLETNATFLSEKAKIKSAELAVKDNQKKLVGDKSDLSETQAAVKEQKEKLTASKVSEAKAAEEAKAAAALAGVASGLPANTTEEQLYAIQQELQEVSLIQEEYEEDFVAPGRKLLEAPQAKNEVETTTAGKEPSEECTGATDTAYGKCQTVVNTAYEQCITLFETALK